MSNADRRRPDWELIRHASKINPDFGKYMASLPVVEVPKPTDDLTDMRPAFASDFSTLPWPASTLYWRSRTSDSNLTCLNHFFTGDGSYAPKAIELMKFIFEQAGAVNTVNWDTFINPSYLLIETWIIQEDIALLGQSDDDMRVAGPTGYGIIPMENPFNIHLICCQPYKHLTSYQEEVFKTFTAEQIKRAVASLHAVIEGLYLTAERRPEPTDAAPAKPHVLKEKPWMREDCPTIICIDPNAPTPTTRAAMPVNSHRSPRHHYRAGYWRRLMAERYQRNGKTPRLVWVKSTTVGNKEWVAEGARYKLIDIPRPLREAQS